MEGGIDGWGGVVDRGLSSCSDRVDSRVGSESAGGSEAAVGAGVVASSDECNDESSGFAIRRPPNAWDRLRSPSMMGTGGYGEITVEVERGTEKEIRGGTGFWVRDIT